MKIDVRSLLELIGVIAVVLSLIFVGLQLQQANTIAGREARTDILALSMELNSAVLEEPTAVDLYLKLRNPNPDLTDREAELAFWVTNLHSNYWGVMFGAVDSGLIPDTSIAVYEETVRRTFRDYPGICRFVGDGFRTRNSTAPRIIRTVLEEVEKLDCQPWAFN